MIMLGVRGKDKISGFEGYVTGYARHITGCDRYLIEPELTKDGKLENGIWFDETRIEVIDPIPKFVDPRRAENIQPPG